MITTILWRIVVAAILPMSLRDIIANLPQIAERLVKLTGRSKRQVDQYRANHRPAAFGVAVGSC